MAGAGGRLWLVGCGNMGGALAARWRAARDELGLAEIVVIDPAAKQLPEGLRAVSLPPEAAPDMVVMAVKPQVWREAAAPLIDRLAPGTLVISIMAGVGIAALQEYFGDVSVVRAMPNTPARLGQAITGLFTTGAEAIRFAADRLFAAVGQTVWLDRETDFDALTGLSGSGPAYLFAMIEAMADAGVAAGLSRAISDKLALATVTGAAALAGEGSASPAALREAVTSPNGTTAAGLAVLTPSLGDLLVRTVAAAAERSRQLALA
jgi:pyrroline-5-carboxylate reductase